MTGTPLIPAAAGNDPQLNVAGGTLVVNGNFAGVSTQVQSGATLKGNGAVGVTEANSGGTIAIGSSPGCMTFDSLAMALGSTWQADVTGSTACSGYDKATVNGIGDLNANPTLQVNQLAGLTLPAGTVLTIIDGTNVTGVFSGLPDGAVFAVNGINYHIHNTSTGEVTLTVLADTVTPTATTPSTTISRHRQ